ncbi:uncharacterized protein LOC103721838 [Phoenix dactylifera]|uniref:Uncharacterized protein LOC103721838 n=1 Tax=Phoenix dactylifera TaxID=42345 RepID=A0A8B7D0W0_PHODC|nr:uncharacterized protein LOC103721838 [Phoenix dactylifera]XP_008810419.2 uncharacterized protein LOC103721838 [Phoenix dactylifera]XP_008810421.2 uncharacterized protein LOC103721838 [Phoenix dactylifera]
MDLETENRLAALLMEEARRLRLQADKEGVQVYLHQPNVRSRPNSRFLTATVLGVQQANRTVEVGEMWRAREKELELEAKLKSGTKDESTLRADKQHTNLIKSSSSSRHKQANRDPAVSSSSSKRGPEDRNFDDDDGLRDAEIEEFLHSRAKRGRGAIGSRMDEPGPYLSSTSLDHDGQPLLNPDVRVKEEWERRVLGPEKPSVLRSYELLKDDSDIKVKTDDSCIAKKHHSKEKKRSEEKKSRKTKRKEKRSKHHHKSRRRE